MPPGRSSHASEATTSLSVRGWLWVLFAVWLKFARHCNLTDGTSIGSMVLAGRVYRQARAEQHPPCVLTCER